MRSAPRRSTLPAAITSSSPKRRRRLRPAVPAAVLLASLALAACTTLPTSARLPLPARPALPPVFAHELECLTPDAYTRLVKREQLLRNYTETLEGVIRSTH